MILQSEIGNPQLKVLPPLDARIPKWSLDKLRPRGCPICGRLNEQQFRRPDQLPLAYCEDCAIWFVCNLPPQQEIEQMYQGYWFSFRPADMSDSYARALLVDRDFLADDLRLNRLSVLSGGLSSRRFLDIGCGCGELLVGAQHRGATVVGSEISREACTFVRERLHIPVAEGPFLASEFVATYGWVDIVTMSDLVEHLVDPLAMLRSAVEVLKPSGLLMVLTPNGGAAGGREETAQPWVGFRVDLEHLQYFSAKTVQQVSLRLGCCIEHLETFGYPGLDGIGTPPAARTHSLWRCVRQQLKKISVARRVARYVRGVRVRLTMDERRGSYHLLAILRKGEAAEV